VTDQHCASLLWLNFSPKHLPWKRSLDNFDHNYMTSLKLRNNHTRFWPNCFMAYCCRTVTGCPWWYRRHLGRTPVPICLSSLQWLWSHIQTSFVFQSYSCSFVKISVSFQFFSFVQQQYNSKMLCVCQLYSFSSEKMSNIVIKVLYSCNITIRCCICQIFSMCSVKMYCRTFKP